MVTHILFKHNANIKYTDKVKMVSYLFKVVFG